MSQTFSLQGKLGLDSRDFVQGAKKAEDAVGDVADELDDLPSKGEAAGSSAGAGLASNMTKAFAAVGVGAVISKALNDAMNVEAGVSRVQAQFALTADEAERYGRMGADLYADAWGDSSTEATTAIATVGQRLQEVGDIADDELSGIATSALAVSDVFGQDFDAVVRSAGQLIRNDLVDDAEEAMDLITVAFQNGGDSAGDLLDTIDEYSQHWARLGIEGDEALGLIVEGFRQGFRDGDKLADLFKEFAIRSLEDRAIAAFNAIGLVGTVTQEQIAQGGTSARQALDDVIGGLRRMEDPIERNRIATELFGTQYEDLGPQVLDVLGSIEKGLGDVEGAAESMAETVSDNTKATLEELKREGEIILAGLASSALELIDVINLARDENADSGSIVSEVTGALKEYNVVLMAAEAGTRVYGSAFRFIRDESPWADQSAAVEDVTSDTSFLTAETQRFGRLGAAAAAAAEAAVTGVGDAANDTETDVEGITEAFQDLRDEISDRSAYFDVKDAFDEVAAAAVTAADTAEKSWDEQDADARNHERSLDDLRLKVLDYSDEVGGLPEEQLTAILADIDEGSLVEAEMRLGEVARRRTMYIDVRTVGGFNPAVSGPGGTSMAPGRADGGPVERGQPYVVGERGRELFVPNQDGMIIPAPQTAALLGTSVAAPTPRTPPAAAAGGFANAAGVTINHYGPNLTAGDVSRGYTLARLAQT